MALTKARRGALLSAEDTPSWRQLFPAEGRSHKLSGDGKTVRHCMVVTLGKLQHFVFYEVPADSTAAAPRDYGQRMFEVKVTPEGLNFLTANIHGNWVELSNQ